MMISTMLDLLVHVILSLLAVKLFFFRKDATPAKTDTISWKSAADSITVLETRLSQLQERDMKLQERVWSLEDQNRDLQSRLARATKELLAFRPSIAPPSSLVDDDDQDAMSSIPTN